MLVMTNKTRKIILFSAYGVYYLVFIGLYFYVNRYHITDSNWMLGLALTTIVLLILLSGVLPRFLEMRVVNNHNSISRNEKLVFNGKEHAYRLYLFIMMLMVVMFVLNYFSLYSMHPERNVLRISLVETILFMLAMSPMEADYIYRAMKNTYTIEGSNLIVDEWAWFRKKTDHLVIPISEITSMRKKNSGLVQTCNVEIQVNGVKRVLTSGIVGDQLYNALRERME